MNNRKNKSSFTAGMYLLETLTSGMYNEPLSIYREYIQNAVDSIELTRNKKEKLKVNIIINPFEKSITITDNGIGIPANNSDKILSTVGNSDKQDKKLRGFRGIGRLGGLAFCDKAIFKTKTIGEDVESIQEWDCKELRYLLADGKKSKKTLKELFDATTMFYQKNGKGRNDSYFSVKLEGVTSFRNYILDVKKVKNYLCQVAPLPFNKDIFSHSHFIEKFLKSKLSKYLCYEIYLNGDQLFKPYCNKIETSHNKNDHIDKVKLFEIKVRDHLAACGWYGIRNNFIGTINRGELFSGIRIRAGNILIGNEHLLDECFREKRFNGYNVGEIYVESPELIPNSRRDDFVDNEAKSLFYSTVESTIGLPISKEIRFRSRNQDNMSNGLIKDGKQKQELTNEKIRFQKVPIQRINEQIISEIGGLCNGCPKLIHIISKLSKIQN